MHTTILVYYIYLRSHLYNTQSHPVLHPILTLDRKRKMKMETGTILRMSFLNLFILCLFLLPRNVHSFSPSPWKKASATFYGGKDASGTMGMYVSSSFFVLVCLRCRIFIYYKIRNFFCLQVELVGMVICTPPDMARERRL